MPDSREGRTVVGLGDALSGLAASAVAMLRTRMELATVEFEEQRERTKMMLILAVVATVFADSNKKYLSTDLSREEPVKSDFMTPRVRLRSFRAFKRVCITCCDPAECLDDEVAGGRGEYELPHCPRRAS